MPNPNPHPNPYQVVVALPVMVLSLVYHNVVPTVCHTGLEP